jgi:hypothetical protein
MIFSETGTHFTGSCSGAARLIAKLKRKVPEGADATGIMMIWAA